MDLRKYRQKHQLSTVEVIEILSQTWPKFSKATLSMVENPEKYGVKLQPQAEAMIRRAVKEKREG